MSKKITYTTNRTIKPTDMSQQALLYGILMNIDLLDNTLTLEHIKILLLLHERGGAIKLTTKKIASAIRVNGQSCKRYLKSLQEKGYIEYYKDTDGKNNVAKLDARGRSFCRTIFQPHEYTEYPV